VISALITVLVVCLIAGLVWYVLDAFPVPEPLNRVAKIVTVVICVLIIIMILLGLAGIDTGIRGIR
jgi:hypothetical protein